VKHQVEVVESGHRVTLQYDLYIGKEDKEEVTMDNFNGRRLREDLPENSRTLKHYNREVIENMKLKIRKILHS